MFGDRSLCIFNIYPSHFIIFYNFAPPHLSFFLPYLIFFFCVYYYLSCFTIYFTKLFFFFVIWLPHYHTSFIRQDFLSDLVWFCSLLFPWHLEQGWVPGKPSKVFGKEGIKIIERHCSNQIVISFHSQIFFLWTKFL